MPTFPAPVLFCVGGEEHDASDSDRQSGLSLERSDLADIVIPFSFRFVWGPLPSPDELATYLAARSDSHAPGTHWSDYVGPWRPAAKAHKDYGLLEFCRHCETVELWFDPAPNDQLQLVWLLDYFRSHPEIVARLRLRLIDYDLISASHEELGRWKMPAVDVTRDELETASMTWQAYRAMTPEACFGLLGRDLSALPLLKPALLDLLEELPSSCDGAWRDGNAAAGADREGILAHQCALSPSGTPPDGVYSTPWKSVTCSRGLRMVRDRP